MELLSTPRSRCIPICVGERPNQVPISAADLMLMSPSCFRATMLQFRNTFLVFSQMLKSILVASEAGRSEVNVSGSLSMVDLAQPTRFTITHALCVLVVSSLAIRLA